MFLGFVIQRIMDGQFVTDRGPPFYTKDIDQAQKFPTAQAAERERIKQFELVITAGDFEIRSLPHKE